MKGQWFLVSAVFIAFSMFAISTTLRTFGLVDTSSVAGYSEDYHFYDLKSGLQRTIALSGPDCGELSGNLEDYIRFAKQSKGSMGYIVDVFYDIEDCGSRDVRFDLVLLQSARYQIWDGIRPQVGG